VDVIDLSVAQYTLLEGSSVMWQNMRDARLHPHIARHYWALCHDSAVVVCSDFTSASGNFFFFFFFPS